MSNNRRLRPQDIERVPLVNDPVARIELMKSIRALNLLKMGKRKPTGPVMVLKWCDYCGDMFGVPKGTRTRYCCQECRENGQSEKQGARSKARGEIKNHSCASHRGRPMSLGGPHNER